VPKGPRRTGDTIRTSRARRLGGLLLIAAAPFVLSGCTLPSFGAYKSATKTGHETYELWQGFSIGAIVIGGGTLLLIIYASLRYRASRRTESDVPRQTQYHLPMEISYTIIPIIIVFILFAFTVIVENAVTSLPPVAADNTIHVQAFQWGWRFAYPGFTVVGQTTQNPSFEIPEGENVRIVLTSNDVVHGFYIKKFNFSRYALPGVINEFTFDALDQGWYFGQCTQLCGLYHSLMWFRVHVVTPTQYQSWLTTMAANAKALSTSAAGQATLQQQSAGIPIKPDYGGGTN
jgi:cytochrome c oxidase subunit II